MKQRKKHEALGALEQEIMEVMWKQEKASVRDVLVKISTKRKIAYTTVMTVMSRLVDKGILKRCSDSGGAYIYCPIKTKAEFLAASSKKMIHSLLSSYGEVAVAQFMDAVSSSNLKDLKDWQKKLKNLK
jgi:predicted transcriptional regulator